MVRPRIAAILLAALCACSSPAGGEGPTPPSPAPTASAPTAPARAAPAPSPEEATYGAIPERVESTPFPRVATPARPAPNFALAFSYGSVCAVERALDTFDGRLTQANVDRTIAIGMALEPAQLALIYERMAAINFFAYPERYTTILPDSMVREIAAPYRRYEFSVRNGDVEKRVVFEDMVSRPTTAETERLRELAGLIIGIVEAQPEMAQLPPLTTGCA